MKRARILVDVDCGAWGCLPAGAVRDVEELTDRTVVVNFDVPMPGVPRDRTALLRLEDVELTDELTG